MKKLLLLFLFSQKALAVGSIGFFQFSPQQLPGLNFLLLPENATSTQWTDISTNHLNAIQTTNANDPLVSNNAFGNFPSVWFSQTGATAPGAYVWVTNGTITGNNTWTTFWAGKQVAVTTCAYYCDGQVSNNSVDLFIWAGGNCYWDTSDTEAHGRVTQSGLSGFQTSYGVFTGERIGTFGWIYTNAIAVASNAVSGSPAGGPGSLLYIGNNPGSHSTNFLCFGGIGYTNALTYSQVQLVNRWFRQRYGSNMPVMP